MANPRVRKVADRIQVIVAEMLERRIKDPRLGFVTVTDVRVSGDTQQASVFYTVLGEEEQVVGSAAALESAKGLIRSEVAKQLGMRHAPTLEFIHDALPDTARHFEEILAQTREADAARAASAAGATYAGEADPYRKPHEADDLDETRTTSGDSRRLVGSQVSAEATPAGLVVVDKPAGMTSHDVVARVRRLAGTRKVGHAGTLDPMATGVLLVGVNRATRLLGHLTLTEKAYDATVRLGASTTTDDAEGETLDDRVGRGTSPRTTYAPPPGAFVGDLEQKPSAVSAIKVDGKRAYARVRDGEDVDLPARPVTVHELLVTDVRAGRRASSTSTCRCAAAAAPTSGRSPATSARRSAPAATSPCCGVRRSGRSRSPRRTGSTRCATPSTWSGSTTWPGAASPSHDLTRTRPATSATAASSPTVGRRARPGGGVRPGRDGSSRSTSSAATSPPPWPSSSEPLWDHDGVPSEPSQKEQTPVQIWRSLGEVPGDLGRTVVTVGNFDGVHRGHQHVVSPGP